MKKLVVASFAISSLLLTAKVQASAQSQLALKLQQLSQATNDQDKARLKQEIEAIKKQMNSNSAYRQQNYHNSTAGAPIGSSIQQPNIQRDTYFYRGPVANPTNYTPYLDQSYMRGYGNNTYMLEGRPVPMLNAPNAYINKLPGNIGGQPWRNPNTNPFEMQHQYVHQNSGQQYFPPGYNPNTGQFGYPGMGMPYGGQMGTQFGYGYGGYNTGYGYPGGYGPGGYGQYPFQGWGNPSTNNPSTQIQRDQQALGLARYDAQQRLRAELNYSAAQTGADRIQVNVANETKLQNGQIQITVTTSGGITGQGIGKNRYYLYSSQGIFIKVLDQPMQGGSPANNVSLKRYQLSNQQKFQIERWLAERGYNQYGDPLGTVYAGGDPLHSFSDGGSNVPGDLRFNYILSKHPSLVNSFQIREN